MPANKLDSSLQITSGFYHSGKGKAMLTEIIKFGLSYEVELWLMWFFNTRGSSNLGGLIRPR